MGMRRLFIIRKDLHLTSGKLAAMVAHCAEAYWTRMISTHLLCHQNSDTSEKVYTANLCLNNDEVEQYINASFTKTICEAKNLNKLEEAKTVAESLGLVEGRDFGFIDDNCLTELTPEFVGTDGKEHCRVGIWFKPLPDETAHTISKKYKLYRD